MKHIKLFEQFLNEMEIGNALFSKDWKNRPWDKFINNDFIRKLTKEYSKYRDEDNTQDEQMFLDKLWMWTEEGDDRDYFTSHTNMSWLYKNLKFLLKLKKKFPLVLDPLKGMTIEKNVYRGTTLDSKIVLDAMKKGKVSFSANKVKSFTGKESSNDFVQIEDNITVDLKSLEKKKSASFSTNFAKAYNFAKRHNLKTFFEDPQTGEITFPRIRCVISVPSNSPNLLFNPDFIDQFSNFFEQEMWYVSDKSIKINGIYLEKDTIQTNALLKKAGIE